MCSLYPRMSKNYRLKTSFSCSKSVAAAQFSGPDINNCCNQSSAGEHWTDDATQFTDKTLPGSATSRHYPLSCLVQLDNTSVHQPSPGRFRCSACQKSYSTVGGLSKHRELHCRALNATDPRRPQQTVAGLVATKDQRCPQCDKAYTSASALKMHIRTHTLPCRCRLCGKAFSRPWLLQGHVRTHTGEKPFTCPHCQRAFADRSNLRAHLQTHYDVKQYHCDVCRRTFSRMSLLLKHRYGACAVITDDRNATAVTATALKQKTKTSPAPVVNDHTLLN